MQFDANLAPARANPLNGHAGSRIAGEIDLYDELLAFAEMSAEEQQVYVAGLAGTKSVNETPQASLSSCPVPVESEMADRVDPADNEAPADSLGVPADSMLLNEKIEVTQAVVESSAAGDPLVDLNLDGAMTVAQNGNECLSCGAVSAADDLFCMSCGSYLNGVASSSSANPTCIDCNQSISADEIFCPWCGSVLAAS